MAERVEVLERALHVGQVGDDVDQQDGVERTADLGQQPGVGHVALQEGEVLPGVLPAGGRHRRRGDVDADAAGRVEGGQEVARAAAEVEHPLPFGDAGAQDPGQIVVVVVVPPAGRLDPLVMGLVEVPHLLEEGSVMPRRLDHRPGRVGQRPRALPSPPGSGIARRSVSNPAHDPLTDRRQSEEREGDVELPLREVLAARQVTVPGHHLRLRRDPEGGQIEPGQAIDPGRQPEGRAEISEVPERVAQRRELPVQHGQDPGGGGVDDRVPDPEVSVDERGRVVGRHVGGQPVDEPLHRRDGLRLGGAVLPHPAVELPGVVVARPPEVGEAGRPPVHLVQAREYPDGVVPERPPVAGREAGQRQLRQDPSRHVSHQVEGSADHVRVLAEHHGLGDRHAGSAERRDHAELPLDGVSRGQELAGRLAPEDVLAARRANVVGRVRLAPRGTAGSRADP